jgi:hypothetical protein
MTSADIHEHYAEFLVHLTRGKTEQRRQCRHCVQSYSLSISHVSRPPASNDVQAFIEHIVAEMGVTTKYRWSEARMNQLWSEGQKWQPIMMDTVDVLKKKIMAWVRAQDAEEHAQDPLSVEVL